MRANQVMQNTHHPRTGSLTPELVASLRNRPPHERFTPDDLPKVGDVIMVRLHEYGPVQAARVLEVDSLTEPHPGYWAGLLPPGGKLPDPNVWRVVTGPSAFPVARPDGLDGYVYELVPDPWPSMLVRIEPVPGVKAPVIYTHTREERLGGIGGWVRIRES